MILGLLHPTRITERTIASTHRDHCPITFQNESLTKAQLIRTRLPRCFRLQSPPLPLQLDELLCLVIVAAGSDTIRQILSGRGLKAGERMQFEFQLVFIGCIPRSRIHIAHNPLPRLDPYLGQQSALAALDPARYMSLSGTQNK